MNSRRADEIIAANNVEAVRVAFAHVLTRPSRLRMWSPPLSASKVEWSVLEGPQVVSTWGRRIGDLRPDPFVVAVLTEHAGYITDPYFDKDAGVVWRETMKELRRSPWIIDASFKSISPGLHVVRISPRIIA